MGKKVVWKKVGKKIVEKKSAVEKKGGGKKKYHQKVEKLSTVVVYKYY